MTVEREDGIPDDESLDLLDFLEPEQRIEIVLCIPRGLLLATSEAPSVTTVDRAGNTPDTFESSSILELPLLNTGELTELNYPSDLSEDSSLEEGEIREN